MTSCIVVFLARVWSILVAAVPGTGKEISYSLRLYGWEGRECASLRGAPAMHRGFSLSIRQTL